MQVSAVLPDITQIKLSGTDLYPIDFLLKNPKLEIRESLRGLLGSYTNNRVRFDETIGFMQCESGGTNDAVRRKLPPHHIFDDRTSYEVTLLAYLLRHEFELGGALNPNKPNIFYSGSVHGLYVTIIEKFGDASWRIYGYQYEAEVATPHMQQWPTGTRIFFPVLPN